jgi:hypothetical protein
MVDVLRGNGYQCGSYSANGNALSLEPQTTSTYDIVTSSGVTQLSSRTHPLLPQLVNMSNFKSTSVYAETWASRLETAL